MAKFFAIRLKNLKNAIYNKIDSIKRSLQYDLNNKIGELKEIYATKLIPSIEENFQWRNVLGALSFESVEDFLRFDKELKTNYEKQQALVNIKKKYKIITIFIKINIILICNYFFRIYFSKSLL